MQCGEVRGCLTLLCAAHSVKRIVQTKIPDLSNITDISEYVLGATAAGAASDSEADDEEAHVTLPQDLRGNRNVKAGRSAIRLVELGPRLTMELLKIEEGVCEGEVLYHSFSTTHAEKCNARVAWRGSAGVTTIRVFAVRAVFGVAAVSKTPEQVAKERKEFERKRQLKAMRRAEQERNVKRKEDEKAAKRQAKKDRREAKKQAQLHAGMVAMEEDEGDLEVVAGPESDSDANDAVAQELMAGGDSDDSDADLAFESSDDEVAVGASDDDSDAGTGAGASAGAMAADASDSDEEWYRKEVGEAPKEGAFPHGCVWVRRG